LRGRRWRSAPRLDEAVEFGPHSGDHDQDRQLLCYPSQSGRGWSDDDAILGLMRVRGAQCRARYAEAFTVEKSVLDSGSDYSVN